MFCYKDRTFCPFYQECKDGSTCKDALTPEVKKAANKWMANAPISVWISHPNCFRGADEESKESV
jgi:hypothetical protein